MIATLLDELDAKGFAFVPHAIQPGALAELGSAFTESGTAGQRHLGDHPAVLCTLEDPSLKFAVSAILPQNAFAFKATLFDKSAVTNWLVAWHRDLSIPIANPIDTSGWHSASVKDGVHYVQPPQDLLTRILAMHINIDPCDVQDGPLRVLPGSHRLKESRNATHEPGELLLGSAGDAWRMRPTLLHASSKSGSSRRRRVLHIEFADFDLPLGMEWHRRVPLG